jgi:hypothetical protein
MAVLVNNMADLNLGGNIPVQRKLFCEDTFDAILETNEKYDMLKTKEALKEIWRLIDLNSSNDFEREELTFPYKTTKDRSKTLYTKKDYWLAFLNQFFCASLENWDIKIKNSIKLELKARDDEIGLTATQRNGDNGWFNRLCFGVKEDTKVDIKGVRIFTHNKDYQPFLSSSDTFADRFQALMFEYVDTDCHPKMNFATPGSPSPYRLA